MFNFSTLLKLYSSDSIAEKTRMMEEAERQAQEMQQQQQQQQLQMQQQQLEQQAQIAQQQQEMQYKMHQEDNETKILVAQINSRAEEQRFAIMQEENGMTREQEVTLKQSELEQRKREFAETLKQNKAKLDLEVKKHNDDVALKRQQLRQKTSTR
jgi:hypothetical protein